MKFYNSTETEEKSGRSKRYASALFHPKVVGIVLGIVVSVVAGYFAIREVAWAEFSEVSGTIKWPMVALAITGLVVAEILRTLRWVAILSTKQRLSTMFAFQLVMVGLVLNLLIPLRFGDVFRAIVLRKYLGVPYGTAGASLVTERFFDVITLAIVFAIAAIGISLPGYLVPVLGIFTAVAVFGAVGIFFVAHYQRQVLKQITRLFRVQRPIVQKLAGFMADFIVGLSPIKNSRTLSKAWGYSFAARIAEVFAIGSVLLSLDINIGIRGFALVNSLTMLGFAIPSGPGAIGSFELLARIGIEMFSVEPARALVGAVLIHGIHIISTLAVGGLATIFIIRRVRRAGISLGSLTSDQEPGDEMSDESPDHV